MAPMRTRIRGEANSPPTRLLGFAPLPGIDALLTALRAVPGPAPRIERGPGIAAIVQAEPETPLIRRGRKALLTGLHTVQRRLEVACQAGPFLPMDPAASCCPTGALARALEQAWDRLAPALARHGASHQWDIVLRWTPEPVLARERAAIGAAAAGRGPTGLADAVAAALRAERNRREAALLNGLSPAVMALAAGGAAAGETEVAITVLVPAGGEAAIEAALEALPAAITADANVDMRGPLPPISFAAARVAFVEAEAVTRAWRCLALPATIDPAGLHRQWRERAASVHPDRHPSAPLAGMGVSDITAAYHLLRDLLTASDGRRALEDLLDRAGYRLVAPARGVEHPVVDIAMPAMPGPAPFFPVLPPNSQAAAAASP